jgi:hypothetical protein
MNRLFDLPSQGNEEWGAVPGWPRYSVSTHGRVHSEPAMNQGRGVSGGIMSPADQGCGYLMLSLKSDGKKVGRTVHSLVMEVHGPEKPSEAHVINHIDGDKKNNHISNLEWVTPAENRLHGALRDVMQEVGREQTFDQVQEWIAAHGKP